MTARSATAPPGNGSKVAVTVLLVVLVAVAMMLIVRASPNAEPFDPRSGADDGARGLVLLLEKYGADVDVVRAVPEPGSERRVLVLQDRLSDAERSQLEQFARSGGVVVMADPESPLVGAVSSVEITGSVTGVAVDAIDESNVSPGTCEIAALTHLRGLFVPEGVLLETGDDPSCFGDGSNAFVVARPVGGGIIVALGDNSIWINRFLRFGDNAGLATALLAPTRDAKVSFLMGAEAPKSSADIGTGERTLFDLVRPGVWMALAQLGIAFVILAWARGVRPGRPVREPEQVPIAGNELVAATGTLMRRARHTARAGELLQWQLRIDLCAHYHLPSGTSIESLDATTASRTHLPPGAVRDALTGQAADPQSLLQLSNRIQEIRDLALEGADR